MRIGSSMMIHYKTLDLLLQATISCDDTPSSAPKAGAKYFETMYAAVVDTGYGKACHTMTIDG